MHYSCPDYSYGILSLNNTENCEHAKIYCSDECFSMNDVYEFRKWLRQYYFVNMQCYDEMMRKVSTVYDTFDFVESVNIDTSALYIEICLKKETDRNKILELISFVSNTIQEYSIDIIEKYCDNIPRKSTYLKLASTANLIFDLYTIGYSLKFAL